jgi:hypothetical protein
MAVFMRYCVFDLWLSYIHTTADSSHSAEALRSARGSTELMSPHCSTQGLQSALCSAVDERSLNICT